MMNRFTPTRGGGADTNYMPGSPPMQPGPTHMSGTGMTYSGGGMPSSTGVASPDTNYMPGSPPMQRPAGGMPDGRGWQRPDFPGQGNAYGRMGSAPQSPGDGQDGGGGNAWGRKFREQYGQAPGQMRGDWDAFRAMSGIGGGQPGQGGGQAPIQPSGSALEAAMARMPQAQQPNPQIPMAAQQLWNRYGGNR